MENIRLSGSKNGGEVMSKTLKNKITLMIIPHTENRIKTLSLTINLIKVSAAALCVLLFLGAVGVWRYYRIKNELSIMPELKKINEENKQQIETTNRQLEQIKDKVKQVEQLENEIQKSLGKNAVNNTQNQLSLLSQREVPSVVQERAVTPSRGGINRTVIGLTSENSFYGGSSAELTLSAETDNLQSKDLILPDQSDLEQLKLELDAQIKGLEEAKTAIARKKAIAQATPSIWPVWGRVTSEFGYRRSPAGRGSTNHEGIDIAASTGTSVRAAADGVVTFAGRRSGYGNVVIISHGYGYSTLYGHNSRNKVKVGERVKKGQQIAFVGSTGISTGPHVHYEVRINGRAVNPRKFL